MEYTIEQRFIEPIRVAYTRYQGLATQANSIMPSVFKSIRGQACGAPFFLYNSMDPQTGIGDIELCVPTEADPQSPGIEVRTVPGGPALTVLHNGPYSELKKAYAALESYAVENQIKITAPFREVYIKGPGMLLKGNPDKYITEIVFPLCKEG